LIEIGYSFRDLSTEKERFFTNHVWSIASKGYHILYRNWTCET